MEDIDITQPQKEAAPYINLIPQTVGPPKPPADVSEQRANKAAIAIPNWLPRDSMWDEITSGREAELRERAAVHIKEQKDLYKNRVVSTFMASKGTVSLTPEETEAVTEYVRQNTEADPKSVFEENYPIQYFQKLDEHAKDLGSYWDQATPEVREGFIYNGTKLMARQQIASTLYEEYKANAERQGWPSYLTDRSKEWLIPGYWQLKLRGHLPYGLLGNDLETDSRQGWSLPHDDQFKNWLSTRAAELAKDNPAMAVEWLGAMMGLSNRDIIIDNFLTGTDFIGKPIGAGLLLKGLKMGVGELYVRQAVKSAMQSQFKERVTAASVQEAVGATKKAAIEDAGQQITNDVTKRPVSSVKAILDNLPGIYNGAIDAIKNNPGRLRREAVERIMQAYTTSKEEMLNAIVNVIKVDRVPVLQAVKQTVRDLEVKIADDYPELRNTLLNNSLRYDPALNGHYVDFYLGPKGTSLFSSQERAESFIKSNNFLDATVEPQGAGFAVVISKPLKETDYVRDVLLHTGETKTPDSWLNALSLGFTRIGLLRTPEETLSLSQRVNRKAATYGVSVYEKLAKKATEDVRKLRSWSSLPYSNRRQKWLEFQKVMDDVQQQKTRFQTPGELDQHYMKSIGRLPDEQETAAAFAWKRGEELYETWRDLQAYKNLHRLGAETHIINIPTTETKGSFADFKPFSFTGVRLKEFPARDDTVMVLGSTLGSETLTTLAKLRPSNAGKELAEKVQNGQATIYQILNHAEQPLQDMGKNLKGQYPRYVIDEHGRTTSKQLEWRQYGQRPPQYDYDHYIKQAIVKHDPITKKWLYLGDKTIAVHNIRAQSTDVANKLDKIRVFLLNRDEAGARAFHATSGLEHEFDEIREWFRSLPVRSVDGTFKSSGPPKLSLVDPIMSLPKGKMLVEMDSEMKNRYLSLTKKSRGFTDIAHEGTARYLGEKYDPTDIFTYRNEGTANNPLYKIDKPQWVNPITSLNRSLARIANASFMDDYKAMSVEHWIQEAAQYFDPKKVSREELMASPYFFFHNADTFLRSGVGDEVMRINNLKTAAAQIKQLIGVPSPTNTWLHSAAQTLSDTLYNRGSPRAALATEWMLPKIRDPYVWMRSMTFHAKLGFFNIPQLWVQAQTFATIFGVAGPKFASSGTRATILYQWSRINRHPEIMTKLDEMASKGILGTGVLAWRPGEWTEATRMLESTGFFNVANEHVLKDNPWKYDVISSGKDTFLNAGSFFFREGEKSVRIAAGYTAYQEFRAAKPTGALTNADKLKILERADLLYANMSRASSSTLQHGIMSIPTQFLSYQLRTAELFLGKRLTGAERRRLFGTYALLYGVPGAMGLSGFPFGDSMRKSALENGYVVGNNYIESALTEGLPSLVLSLISGEYFNVQERYGVQGFEPIREAMRGDKTLWDIATGATGQTVANAIEAFDPFFHAMMSLYRGDGQFPFHAEDLLEPFKEIPAVNNTWKLFAAVNIGKVVSKKGGPQMDISKMNAVFSYLSGLSPQAITDNYIKLSIQKDEEKFQSYTLSQFLKETRRGAIANANGDTEQAIAYMKRARNWLEVSGYPMEKRSAAWAIAAQGMTDFIDKGDWSWSFGSKVPTTRQPTAAKQFIQERRLRNSGE